MVKNKLKDMVESLEIRLKHLENDYLVTKEENEISTTKYLEILSELKDKNKKLHDLQKNLEKKIEERTRELRKSEKILQEKSEELQIMLDSSPAMIFYKDKKNRFVRVNKSFADLLGMPVDDIIGKKDFELFPEDTEHFKKGDLEVIQTGKAELNIVEHLKTSKGERWIVIDKIPYRDINGNIVGIIGFALDFTERKYLEEQLLQSEKLASIGQVLSGMAHELNNPLSIVSGFSELMKSVPYIKKEEQETLDKIIWAAQKCSAVVENLLKFSRKYKIEKTNVRVNDIICDSVALRENQFKVDNIIIEKDLSPTLPITVGDSNQLHSVFLNIINNAYDAMYTANKKGKLIIKTYQEENDIVVKFIDDGPGVPKEYQDKLFDPFFTTKDVGKGTGLGLSLSYKIIQEHRGKFYLDKTYNKGAKFVVKIPILGPIEKKVLVGKGERLPYKANVLIIDDEPEILELQRRVLKSKDYNVYTAGNCKKGFDLINKNNYKYDIIICDMKMPGRMNGKDLYYQIKLKNEELAKRVIFVTGDISDETKEFFKRNNILYMRKPFKIDDFLAAVGEGMKRENNGSFPL